MEDISDTRSVYDITYYIGKMKARPNYDNGYIKVTPRGAGDFGGFSMSGEHYKNNNHLDEMKDQIERHADRVRYCEIIIDGFVCGECESEYDTEKEAEECCKEA